MFLLPVLQVERERSALLVQQPSDSREWPIQQIQNRLENINLPFYHCPHSALWSDIFTDTINLHPEIIVSRFFVKLKQYRGIISWLFEISREETLSSVVFACNDLLLCFLYLCC